MNTESSAERENRENRERRRQHAALGGLGRKAQAAPGEYAEMARARWDAVGETSARLAATLRRAMAFSGLSIQTKAEARDAFNKLFKDFIWPPLRRREISAVLLARIFGVSRNTIAQWANEGRKKAHLLTPAEQWREQKERFQRTAEEATRGNDDDSLAPPVPA